jgi:hypothetical protein
MLGTTGGKLMWLAWVFCFPFLRAVRKLNQQVVNYARYSKKEDLIPDEDSHRSLKHGFGVIHTSNAHGYLEFVTFWLDQGPFSMTWFSDTFKILIFNYLTEKAERKTVYKDRNIPGVSFWNEECFLLSVHFSNLLTFILLCLIYLLLWGGPTLDGGGWGAGEWLVHCLPQPVATRAGGEASWGVGSIWLMAHVYPSPLQAVLAQRNWVRHGSLICPALLIVVKTSPVGEEAGWHQVWDICRLSRQMCSLSPEIKAFCTRLQLWPCA